MKSRSKYQISNEDISKIFLNFGVKDIGDIEAFLQVNIIQYTMLPLTESIIY